MNELNIASSQMLILKLREIVLANLHNENFGVKELLSASGMSRSTVHRRLKAEINKPISRFIREVRLDRAMEMLQTSNDTVAEIAYNVGFKSPTYFNSCFHHYFGFPPGEIKRSGHSLNHDVNTLENEQQIKIKYNFALPKFIAHNKRVAIIFLCFSFICSLLLPYLLYQNVFGNRKDSKIFDHKSKEKSIAILPFKNLSNDPENQYFADGVTENIINILCSVENIKVISRASVEQFRESDLGAREIAKRLKVEFILEGSIQRDGEQVKIMTQLIDARNDRNVWSEKSENHLYNIFAVQSNIAQKIAVELKTMLSPEEIQQLEYAPTKNTEAYNLYLKGRFFWNTRTVAGLRKSKGYFEQAIAADPEYANAYNGLADTYFITAWMGWTDRNTGFALAKKNALKALEIDPTLPEAHATLGGILCWAEWNWEEAEKEMITSIELNSHYTTGYQYYSELLGLLGRKDEELAVINTALEFNPFSNALNDLKSLYYFDQGKYDESLRISKNAVEFDPIYINNYWRLFYIYLKQGKELNAVESLKEIILRDSVATEPDFSLDRIYTESGIRGILNWLIDNEIGKANPRYMFVARWYILLGNENESLRWLEMAMNFKSPLLPRINTDPDFDCLRSKPQFKQIIAALKLPHSSQ